MKANRDRRFASCTSMSKCNAQCRKVPIADARRRMLENPTDENVVRWGNDGDSFVVLEVRRGTDHGSHAGR